MKSDKGFDESEKILNQLEKDIHKEYAQAVKEMNEKVEKYFAKFKSEDEAQRELYEQGKITKKEYGEWRQRKMLTGKQYTDMRDTLAKDLTNTDKIAMSYIRNSAIDTYALNMNYETYHIEHDLKVDTSFSLYNHDAVERMIKDKPDLLPQPSVDIPKDMKWNMQHLQSAITQSILQGESIPKVAARMMQVAAMDNRAAIRNARTAMTGAQNGGRLDAMERAKERGIDVKKGWMATLDDRTRDSHVELDGEEKEIDEEFSNGLMFPGDPDGEPAEVYNCRCRMIHVYPKYPVDWSNTDLRNTDNLGDMTYEEWKNQHSKGENENDNAAIDLGIQSIPFTPASTIEEAEEFAKNFVGGGMNLTGKTISYKGIDLQMANAINGTLNDVYGNFKIDKLSSIESFGKVNKRIYQQHQDAPFFTTNFGNIGINSTIVKDAKTLEKYNESGKESFRIVMENIDKLSGVQREIAEDYKTAGKSLVGDSIEDMIRHEVGHHISYLSGTNKKLAEVQKQDDWKEYASHLSGYANHSFGEYVAESFNAYCRGEHNSLQPDMITIFDKLRK